MFRLFTCVLALASFCTFGACTDTDDIATSDVDLEERAPEPVPGVEQPVAGTYRLIRLADQALPAPIAPTEECARTLRSATLTIAETDQAYRLEGEIARECPGEADEVERVEEDGNYIIEGSTIHFGDDLEAGDLLPEPREQTGASPAAFTLGAFAGDGTIGDGDTLTVRQPGTWTMAFAPAESAAN